MRLGGAIETTISEQNVHWRELAAGAMMGLALGHMIASFIAIRPELFRVLMP
jgi:hypothetical protein